MTGMAARWLARKNPPRSWAEIERSPFQPGPSPTARDLYSRRTLVGMPPPRTPTLAGRGLLRGTRVIVCPGRAMP